MVLVIYFYLLYYEHTGLDNTKKGKKKYVCIVCVLIAYSFVSRHLLLLLSGSSFYFSPSQQAIHKPLDTIRLMIYTHGL